MEQIYHVIVQIKKDKWDTIKYYDDDGNITSTAYSYTLHLNKFIDGEVDEIRGIFFNENYIELKDHNMSCDSIGDMIQIKSDKLPDIDLEFLIYFTQKVNFKEALKQQCFLWEKCIEELNELKKGDKNNV